MNSNNLKITSQEIGLIQQFRSRVADVLPADDWHERDDTIIRWIRAREGDLKKAEDMFRNSLNWRTTNKIYLLAKKEFDFDLKARFPFYLDGFDKIGRPVITILYGEWDVRTFIEAEGPTRFVNYTNQFLESILHSIKKASEKDESQRCIQFVMISDMAGYSYRQLGNMKAVQSVLQIVSAYEAHYPETLGQCVVINAPSVFSILFGMMKPFMSGRTMDKISIYPADKGKWAPVIHSIVEPSQIRHRFGGTKDFF